MLYFQNELDEVRRLWNSHRIRPVRNKTSPSGRPIMMYTCPELYGSQDYINVVPRVHIDSCLEECVHKSPFICDETVFEISTMIMEDNNLQKPKCGETAAVLYQTLRREILAELFDE